MNTGEKIRQKVKEKGWYVTDFAKAIHRSRRCVYHIFHREKLDKQLLQEISQILDYDFSDRSHETDVFCVVLKVDEEQLQEITSKFQILFISKV